MKDYTRDDFLPLEELEVGRAYILDSRNLAVGVWNPDNRSFIGVREKFGSTFLDEELIWSDYGTALPRKALDVRVNGIALRVLDGSFCETCQQPVKSIWENPDGETYRDKGKCLGNTHIDQPTDCDAEGTYCAYARQNQPLYDWLKPLDDDIRAARS